ncbi:MAG: AAA-like domain-containing protein [Verrucomicrobia bacterium]|nr:AAA-like domain-containing protein [Verrucomicrobiota bacterium]
MIRPVVYAAGGTVQAAGGIYITRRADQELLELCRAGTFAYILYTRQSGKSSLMIHTAEQLAKQGVRSVIVDLTQIGTQVTSEQWYLGLLEPVEEQLTLKTNLVEWWRRRADLGMTQRLTLFFREVVLNEIAERVVVFVDEIDTTLSLNFTDDFFAAIRYLFNARAHIPELRRLSFMLSGVATPGDLVQDPDRTPFNIGQRIELTDFSFEEALPFAAGFAVPPEQAHKILRWILEWTGGHPYLTQRLCSAIAAQAVDRWTAEDVGQEVSRIFLGEKSRHESNLEFVRDMLTKRIPRQVDKRQLLETYKEIHSRRRAVVDEEQSLIKSHLKLAGIVRRENGKLRVRNVIYERVFDGSWIRENLPTDWRKAFLRAVKGLVLILFILVILGSLAMYAWHQRNVALSRELAASSLRHLSSDVNLSLLLACEAARVSGSDQAEDALQRTLMAQRQRAVLRGHDGPVNAAVFSPNGRFLVSAGADGVARVWDTNQRQTVTIFTNHMGSINSADFNADSQRVVTASDDQTARVWEARTGRELVAIKLETPVQSAKFSPDGEHIATVSVDDTVRLWVVKTGEKFSSPPPQTNLVTSIAFSPNGKLLAVACDDNIVRLWEEQTWWHLTNFVGHAGFINDVSFSPDSLLVVTASDDQTNRVWRTTNGRPVAEFKVPSGYSLSAVFSPNAQFVLTAGQDGAARIFDLSSKETVVELKGHDGPLNQASYSPDGKTIITAGADGTARLWEAPAPYSLESVREFRGPVYPLAFAKDNNLVVIAGWSDFTQAAKPRDSNVSSRLPFGAPPPSKLADSPDRRFAVVALGEDTAGIQSVSSSASTPLSGLTHRLTSAAFSCDGLFVAGASIDGAIHIWESRTGQPIGRPKRHGSGVTSVVFSPNCQLLLTASADATARLWSVFEERSIPPLQGHAGVVTCAVFSPDGRHVATGGADKTARLWDSQTGEQLGKPFVHKDPVNCVAFHPDGQSVVTGTEDGHIRRWSMAKQRIIATLRGVEPLASLLPTPDGNWVVGVTKRGTSKIYPWEVIAPVDDLIALADRRTARQLSPEERRRYLHER